jgi:hypothetical protein
MMMTAVAMTFVSNESPRLIVCAVLMSLTRTGGWGEVKNMNRKIMTSRAVTAMAISEGQG